MHLVDARAERLETVAVESRERFLQLRGEPVETLVEGVRPVSVERIARMAFAASTRSRERSSGDGPQESASTAVVRSRRLVSIRSSGSGRAARAKGFP